MKKIKKSEEERQFIESAPVEKLLDYVLKYPFRPKNEKYLVERGDPGSLSAYIELYGLKPSAAIMLFRLGDYELAQCLLNSNHDSEIIKLFLNEGCYEHVHRFVNKHPGVAKYLPEYQALKFMSECKSELLSFIKSGTMSPFAKLDILVRGDDELKNAVIRKGGLQPREREYLLYFGTEEQLELWSKIERDEKLKDTLRQIILIRFCAKRPLMVYMEKNRLRKVAEEFLFYMVSKDAENYFDVAIHYIRKYRPEGGDKILFAYATKEKLLQYLSKHRLTEEGEAILVKRMKEEEVFAYIQRHYLNDEYEEAFVTKASNDLIADYIIRHSLCDQAQVALVRRGEVANIAWYKGRYPMCYAAEDLIDEMGLKDEVQSRMVA